MSEISLLYLTRASFLYVLTCRRRCHSRSSIRRMTCRAISTQLTTIIDVRSASSAFYGNSLYICTWILFRPVVCRLMERVNLFDWLVVTCALFSPRINVALGLGRVQCVGNLEGCFFFFVFRRQTLVCVMGVVKSTVFWKVWNKL